MGTSWKQKAQTSWNLKGQGTANFKAIEEAVGKRYPDLALFDDWSF